MAHELYIREFPADLEIRELADDGMLVEGLVVPFGIEAPIIEPREDGVIRYREAFAPGSCDRAIRAPHWVSLTYNHSEDMSNRMGHGREFRESAEGLVGIFKLDASHAAQARDILTSSHRAFSVGFTSVVPRPLIERPNSLVVRKSVILRHVAAVPAGAYAMAMVSSVREGAEGDDVPTGNETADALAKAELADVFSFIDEAAEQQKRWDALLNPDPQV
jgi:HK97 family phage prohead protease